MDNLNPQERAYVEARLLGMTPYQSADRAGFAMPEQAWPVQERKPKIRAMLDMGFAEAKERFQVSRDEVVEGIREGIEIAKLTDDAGNVIRGWSEIARICGLVAPQQTQVKVDVTTQTLLPSQYQELSDADLLRLVGRQRVLEGDYVEEECGPEGGAGQALCAPADDGPIDVPDVFDPPVEEQLPSADEHEADHLRPAVQGVRLEGTGRKLTERAAGEAAGKAYARRSKRGDRKKARRGGSAASAVSEGEN